MFPHQEREGKVTMLLQSCKHLAMFFIQPGYQQRTLLVKRLQIYALFSHMQALGNKNFELFYTPLITRGH